jgi:hypothetical protein
VSGVEAPSTIGSNIEELIRHYPDLLQSCTEALVGEIKNLIGIAGSYDGITMDDKQCTHPLAKGVRFVSIIQYATSILQCLVVVLSRKEAAVEFLLQGGAVHLLDLLRAMHTPQRYLLASLACSPDPTTHSLGHQPIVKVCMIYDASPIHLIVLC